jgi:hypothetical protein
MINRTVRGQQGSQGSATDKTKNCAYSGALGTTYIGKEAARAVRYCRADPRSCARTHCSPNESVAQTVFVLHESHATNVLLLDGLFACAIPVVNRRLGDSLKYSGRFCRSHPDDLDLLSGR